MGPSAMRVAGLEARLEGLGHQVTDGGNIQVDVAETLAFGNPNARYLKQIAETCTRTADAVVKTLEDKMTPLVLGGDHSLAVGSVSGVAEFYRRQSQRIGVIWIDAHSDINTPDTSPSGNVHGMPLAALLGSEPAELARIGTTSPKVLPAHTVLVGIRNLDEREKVAVRDSGVHVFTMKDIDRQGIASIVEQAVQLAGAGTAGIHVSFDIDVCDPLIAPGVGTPVKGGLDYREAHMVMEIVADSGLITSLDLVEVNPTLDVRNTTAQLATELTLSALGMKIL